MLSRFCDGVVRLVEAAMAAAFTALIATVALQVLARNLLHEPMIWTGDLAQLLFTWLIFIGAAVGLRKGAHYTVDLLPEHNALLNQALEWISIVAGLIIVYLLVIQGWILAELRSTGSIQSLNLSHFWTFVSMPVSGVLMLLFLVEIVVGRKAADGGPR